MANVLPFTQRPPSKFGFERVSKRKKGPSGRKGQLNLFGGREANVLRLPSNTSPFEEALLLDERADPLAEEAYRTAISEGDGVADAYCNLGILQSRAGKTAQAFDSLTKSLEHTPRHFESHFNLGNLYFDAGDLKLARLHYEMAVKIDGAFANLYFNLGLVLASQGELSEAIGAFRRYQSLVPDDASKANNILATLQQSLDLKNARP